MGIYVFSELAVQDINEICEFVAQNNVRAASQLFDAIRQKCKLVFNFPNMGKDYSWIAPDLKGFIYADYVIFYYPKEDGIEIARIAYGRRDLAALFEEFEDDTLL
ncbi:type II toxin-antitoxin system RelE/ParE family toxin [Nodosilinea sp. AN01ver1]|uniref:type II toxin-antitoxin system RelE/ParE family toxin n=1 Tax=Nodosilinea sp. AN01ver1 TaxID=3423362 RepID=UPI003D3189F7